MTTNVEFFDDLHISNISVVSGIRYAQRTIDHSCYGRKCNGILFVWGGEATFFNEQNEVTVVSNGELVFLPKHKKYRLEYTAQSTTFVVVNFDLCDKGGQEVSLFEDITLLAKDDQTHRIARIMTNFELCSVAKTTETVLRKKELIYRLLGMVYAAGSSFAEKDEVNSKIVEGVHLLEQTYLENCPISKYAEASHVSVNTFRSLFQTVFGITPLKYRNRLRIERAKELLSEGEFTVAEAAYSSGFENIGYFCRYYRQITGESPGETKRKHNTK